MSVTQSLIGVGTMIYPIFVQFLMEKYGFRGAVAIIAACNAHAIFAMLCMHPVKWHYKVIRVPIAEEKPRKFLLKSTFFGIFVNSLHKKSLELFFWNFFLFFFSDGFRW